MTRERREHRLLVYRSPLRCGPLQKHCRLGFPGAGSALPRVQSASACWAISTSVGALVGCSGSAETAAAMTPQQQANRDHKGDQCDGLRTVNPRLTDYRDLDAQEFQQKSTEGVLRDEKQQDIAAEQAVAILVINPP